MSVLTLFLSLFPEFSELKDAVRFSTHEGGSYILREGDPLQDLFFFIEGKAWVVQNLANGRTVLFEVYRPGEIIGDMEYYLGSLASCSVKCTEKVTLGSVSFEAVKKLSKVDPNLDYILARGLAKKLYSNSNNSARNVSFPLINRLAFYMESTHCAVIPKGDMEELSEMLGTTRRHLRRVISQLEEMGCAERTSRGLEPRNTETLRVLSSEIEPGLN